MPLLGLNLPLLGLNLPLLGLNLSLLPRLDLLLLLLWGRHPTSQMLSQQGGRLRYLGVWGSPNLGLSPWWGVLPLPLLDHHHSCSRGI